jgi:ABC-type Fe3+ transport system permease subunit
MNVNKHYVALMEVLLILPAMLFMASLVVRELPSSGFDAAAQRTVMWYAERQWTLWLLLVTLPLVVLVVGCATVLKGWDTERVRTVGRRPSAAIVTSGTTLIIAALSLVAAIILVIVGLHILAN